MNFKNLNLIGFCLSTILISSCVQNSTNSNKQTETQSVVIEQPKQTVFEIKGEEIPLREGPGKKFKKVINEKATQYLGETQYAEVDYSVKVEIVDEKDNWSKVRVVEPSHLSASHIGWIPSEYIVRNELNSGKVEKLDATTYEILKTKHNATVDNFYVLIKFKDFDKDKIRDFISKFRNEQTKQNANVFVFDSKSVQQLIDKYPLEKAEYLIVADHFVATSTFDSPKLLMWYPYQDSQYKEYGGRNWKKDPIK